MKEISIFMDDSGKLTKKEDFCLYSGIVFLNDLEMNEFQSKYIKLLNSFKCSYCGKNKIKCDGECKEVKSFVINNEDRRKIINLCKKYKTFSFVIDNNRVYDYILKDKASKGRYIDYTMKLTIKDIIICLLEEGHIKKNDGILLRIRIDQQTTKSNGYYNLRDGLYEELIHGISNYNYGIVRMPILTGELKLSIKYLDSKKNYYIQASDILAGTTRRYMYFSEPISKRMQRINSYNWVVKRFP